MRAALLVLFGASLLVASACGGGGNESGQVSSGSAYGVAPTPAPTPPPFRAADALIALSDLPPGWAVEPDDDDDEETDFCGRKGSALSLVGIKSADKAEAQYAEGGAIPLLAHSLGAYLPGEADAAFDGLRTILSDCTSLKSDGTEFTVVPVSFPELGDESIPLLFSGEVEGITVSFYFVIVRVGDGITIVGYGGLSPDVAEVEKFARLAVTKLREAQAL